MCARKATSPYRPSQAFRLPWSAYVRLISVKSHYAGLLRNRGITLWLVDLKVGKFSYADAGQMHLYLNYARENWMKPGENPPVGLILCTELGASEARYSIEGLSNTVLAAEYRTVLPDERLLAEKLDQTRRELEAQHSVSRIEKTAAS